MTLHDIRTIEDVRARLYANFCETKQKSYPIPETHGLHSTKLNLHRYWVDLPRTSAHPPLAKIHLALKFVLHLVESDWDRNSGSTIR